MPDQILNSHKLATLSEFRYMLLEVLDRKDPISWYDLSFTCKELSLNFAFAFENTVAFLHLISLVQIHADRSVSRVNEDYSALAHEQELALFIMRKTVVHLQKNKSLEEVFNKKTVTIDATSDVVVIQVHEFPPAFVSILSLLLNLGMVTAADHEKGKLLVVNAFKPYFNNELLPLTAMPPRPISPDLARPAKVPTFFISYAEKDREFKNELQNHFSGLKRRGEIKDWEGRAILPGADWDDEIRKKLEEAEVVLFLVSSDFLASEYIHDVEIKKTIERHLQGKVRIIPIILRPCDFESLPIKRYQALPEGAKPISTWTNRDEAYLNIVKRIKDVIKQMSNQTTYLSS